MVYKLLNYFTVEQYNFEQHMLRKIYYYNDGLFAKETHEIPIFLYK